MAYPPATPPITTDVTDVTPQTTRHAGDHNSIADWLAVIIPSAWVNVNPAGGAAPAFNSPWTNFGSGFQVVRFRREGGDICRLEGHAAGGNTGTSIFTLPIGYRPAQNMRFFVQDAAATSPGNTGIITINSDGTITNGYFSGSGAVTLVNLNVTFAIDPASL